MGDGCGGIEISMSILVHGLPNPTKIFHRSVHSSHGQTKRKLSSKVVGVEKPEAFKVFRMANHVSIEFAFSTRDLVGGCSKEGSSKLLYVLNNVWSQIVLYMDYKVSSDLTRKVLPAVMKYFSPRVWIFLVALFSRC
jgi:hypothetical protein